MNSVASSQSADSANLPINKKAKAVQKRLATENTVEAIQQKRSAAISRFTGQEAMEALSAGR